MKLMNSKEFLDKNIRILKEKLDRIDKDYSLVIIQTINSNENEIYVKAKKKLAEFLGIKIIVERYFDIDTDVLVHKIEELNNNKKIMGIIIQLPLADNLDKGKVLDAISPLKDVDGLTSYNMGKLVKNEEAIIPATVRGIIDLLDYYKITIEGQNVVVIGKSLIVGKPLSNILVNKGATVTVCHSKTRNIEFYTREADIIIVAVGKARFLKGNMIKKGAIVIDVGINKINDKIVGDVDFDSVKDKVSFITPVPGGVGPMTVYELMNNLYEMFLKKV